jgi:UTP--glucose-1-phosphate uridylyltransferase
MPAVFFLGVFSDVSFGAGVVLRGQVVIVATDNQHLTIPGGAILENCIVEGALDLITRN